MSPEWATPVRTALVDEGGRVLTAVGLIVLATILAYTGPFMPTFAVKLLGLPASTAFAGPSCSVSSGSRWCPFSARCRIAWAGSGSWRQRQ